MVDDAGWFKGPGEDFGGETLAGEEGSLQTWASQAEQLAATQLGSLPLVPSEVRHRAVSQEASASSSGASIRPRGSMALELQMGSGSAQSVGLASGQAGEEGSLQTWTSQAEQMAASLLGSLSLVPSAVYSV